MSRTNHVTASRRVEASAAAVFALLSDPGRHSDFDGSGMLVELVTPGVLTNVGNVFTMRMHNDFLGNYAIDNHVVEFEPNRRISWEPVAGMGHPEVGGRVGHRWGFRLSPDGPDVTIVTEIYDCSRAPSDFRQQMNDGTMWIESMKETLKRLDNLVARRGDPTAPGL